MDALADSSFMQWVYGEMGSLALAGLLFIGAGLYRELVVLPERRRGNE